MRFIKNIIILFIFIILVSCSSGASYEQQQEVKNQVMELLMKEYKQPFKLESFEYEYKTHYPNASGNVPYETFGTYYFKIKAVDNPIIVMDFNFNDGLATKESIEPLIDSFKKNQLNDLYCGYFDTYYSKHFKEIKSNKSKDVIKTEKFCDSRNQSYYKRWDKIFKDK